MRGQDARGLPSARIVGALGLAAALLLGGCSSLPTSGPTTSDVMHQETVDNQTRFDLVDISDNVIAALHATPHEEFRLRFKKYGKPAEPRIGVGDSIVVSIWEAAGGGLFSASPTDQVSAGSRSVTIPEQVVGRDGAITVPFAGRIAVAGRLPLEVQHDIEKRLADKAIEPQVIVTISKSMTNTVTVNGEVVGGARVPLSLKGDRLLDLIAEAGGAKSPVYETYVRLSRDGVTATIPMEALVSDPAENIYAQPGDVLTLVRQPETFTVFGATGANTQVNFPSEHLTLIEALAKAGGLQDLRSDPAGVFLMRFEPPPVVAALGRPQLRTGPDGTSPVVYRLDMSNAKAYFLAQRFPVEDKDVVYVANADLDELQKFFTLLNTLTGPIITGIVVKGSTP
ncbi:MAG TPA: polysaccharide biosynthesis/export family protein [Stellaceae bacterium]|jgi:polysaccharide export outer membrane protein|nr:polysaccharide biosynthesis/export family protein [Stellaceae bacterium]